MRRVFNAIFWLSIVALSVTTAALASAPAQLSYQGYLTDGAGDPVSDGPYYIRFRIYDADVAGSTLWDSGIRQIEVLDGLFAYNLGDTVAIPSSIFQSNPDLWVGVKVGTDPELSPRTKLTSVGYAFEADHALAATVADNSDALESLPGSYYLAWANLTSVPAGFADGVDDTTSNLDWSALTSVPAGFADGTDDGGDHDIAYADATYVNLTGDIMSGTLGAPGLDLGTALVEHGRLSLYNSSVDLAVVSAGPFGTFGGKIGISGQSGVKFIRLESDASTNHGGYFSVARNSSEQPGFKVDGNFVNTEEPQVSIMGISRSMIFTPSYAGNSSVQLPTDAISSDEMFNEPGIAMTVYSPTVTFTQGSITMTDLGTIQIAIPEAGYIVVRADLDCQTWGTTGSNYYYSQIDETAGGSYTTGHYRLWGATSNNSPILYYHITHTRAYFKSAGTYTFRLEGLAYTGNSFGAAGRTIRAGMTATYYPTSYGTVETVVASPGNFDNAEAVSIENADGNMTTAYKVDLRDLEIRATRARLEAEKSRREADRLESELSQARADKQK